ncbi:MULTISPECIES: TcaA 3rd/4th domain-containing protein [Clostridium]|uniref:TcaA 3rd/4th domain-containing protein n=1 Tax=Clostridium TaxID=1485 RepID=UPI001596D57C|nr:MULTISPECIES: hypothetical protein [Clostridium]MDB1921422.1 hypothetical protein [Clostridium tertium]MDB1928196.1 hypothetical protein [Clostridium tertium]MDB1942371.1 hypothetical protein [Clostridium tertium]MDB1947385.1 hypothetical protein [Clostridium tertium]
MKNLEISLKENKPGRIFKKIRVDDKKISKKDLQPLAEYYSDNTNQVDDIIRGLKSNEKSRFFTLKNDKILFFNNYKIQIEPVSIKINTNFDDAKIYVDNGVIDATKIKRGLIPGKYIIRGELDTLYGKVVEEQEIFLMQNEEYILNLKAININLSSNFDDADVVINDKKVNKKVKDIKNYGPIPINKGINIYLEREFPWGVLKSEKVNVGGLPNINIDINMVNDKLLTEIDSCTNIFYSSVFDALNLNDYSLIKNADEDAKNKIYDSVKRESLFLKNNYELTELNTEVRSSEFYYENKTYKANIVINLDYSVSKKLIPFIKDNVNEMFLTQMEYVDGKWEITNVQKFNLE